MRKELMRKLRALGFRSLDRKLKAQEAALEKGDTDAYFASMPNPFADKFWVKYQNKAAKRAAYEALMASLRFE